MQKSLTRHPVVILGMTIGGLAVARSLRRRGCLVWGLGSSPWLPEMWSRCIHPVPVAPLEKGEGPWLDFLLRFGRRAPYPPVILPCSDKHVALLANHREALEPYFRFVLPNPKLLDQLSDKRGQYLLMEKHNIPRPISFFPENDLEAQLVSQKVSYPCALKPLRSLNLPGFPKLWPVHSARELVAMYQKLHQLNIEVMVTELIPGGDDHIFTYCTYLDSRSQSLCHFTKQKLRQHPIRYGIGCLHVSTWRPEVAELGLHILQSIGYRGICFLELKRDGRDDCLKFVELNMRMGLGLEIAISSGVDIPWISYQDAVGVTLQPVPIQMNQRDGIKLIHADWDLASAWGYWIRGELSLREWIKSLEGKRVYGYYNPNDPLPSVIATVRFGWQLVKRFFYMVKHSIRKLIKGTPHPKAKPTRGISPS